MNTLIKQRILNDLLPALRVGGALDALALLMLALSMVFSTPWAIQLLPYSSLTLYFIAAAIGITSGMIFWIPRWKRLTDPVQADLVETPEFILPSDPVPVVKPNEGLLLGYTTDQHKPVIVPYQQAVRHMTLVGSTGVGKTTLGKLIIWQQMIRGGGFIFIDAKIDVDTRDALQYMARVCGREHEFHIVNPDNPANSNTINPVLAGSPDEVASRLMNLQPSSENNPGADHYRQSANYALTVFIAALQRAKLAYTFLDLSIILQSPSAIEELIRMTPKGTPERVALEVFVDKFRHAGKDGSTYIDMSRLKDTLGGMAGRIALFAQGNFGQIFNTYEPEIDLEDIIKNNKMLYIMLPTMAKDTAALNIGKMILSDLRSATAKMQSLPKNERPSPPFFVFADEMGSYAMEGIGRLLEQARSAGIIFAGGFQAYGNLANVSDTFSDIVIQSTLTKVSFQFASTESAELASEMMGKSIRYMKTVTESSGDSDSGILSNVAPQTSVSNTDSQAEGYRETEINRITPDHLRGLNPGECIVSIGKDIYHIKVPNIETPIDRESPDDIRDESMQAKPYRFHRPLPSGIRPAAFGERYEKFLAGPQKQTQNN